MVVARVRVGMTFVGIVRVGDLGGKGAEMLSVGAGMLGVGALREGVLRLDRRNVAVGAVGTAMAEGLIVLCRDEAEPLRPVGAGISAEGTVGAEMLRLGDGIANDGRANGGTLKNGMPIVGFGMFRLGGGTFTDGTPTEGKSFDRA